MLPNLSPILALFAVASIAASEQLILTDSGVGHRSRPVPTWRTSIRRLNTDGTSPERLAEFGERTPQAQPIGSSSLAVANGSIYTATGQGIIRTDLDGNNNLTIIPESSTAITVSGDKIYYGIAYTGLIKRANLDGTEVETFLNVSQGINYNILPSYTPAYFSPDGIAIDNTNGFIYWSASNGPDNGSIRRAPLKSQGAQEPTNVEVLVEGINMPGQLRINLGYLYWAEKGRWSNSPTSIRRAKFPTSLVSAPGSVASTTIVHSNQSSIFYEQDFVPENQTLSIRSFAVDERSGRMWFAMQSSNRVMFARIVQVFADGSGELLVLNQNTTEVGIPVGLEYVK